MASGETISHTAVRYGHVSKSQRVKLTSRQPRRVGGLYEQLCVP